MEYIATFGAAFVFIIVVSTDLFVCGFGYGLSKIHVPFRKFLVINIIGSAMVGIGLFTGYYIGSLFDVAITNLLSFGILCGLGLFKIAGCFSKRKKPIEKQKRLITWPEAVILAVALSIDGLAVGIGATLDDYGFAFIFTVIGLSLITDHIVFALGQHLGNKLTKKINLDLSWLSGVLLIVIAILGLFL